MTRASNMTKEEALLVRLRLMAHRGFGAMVENGRGGSEEAKKDLDAIDLAIATIQSKIALPQPDPITGLVPCGCGCNPELRADDRGWYQVYCTGCDMHGGNSHTPDNVIEEWNEAMGYKGGAE